MAHLAINPAGWRTLLARATTEECANLADLVGLTTDEVAAVMLGGASPTEHFVACCLYALPAEFADLFTVKPPLRVVVAAA